MQLENNGFNRIYLQDVLLKINKKDIRSVIKWCEDNDVNVFSDSSGRFIIVSEFEFAYDRPIIDLYKKRFGGSWLNVYSLAKENNLHLLDVQDSMSRSVGHYEPVSREAHAFLKKCA